METKAQTDVAKATMQVIAHSTGTLGYTRGCGINRGLLCTDGIMGVAQEASAYWLIDIVGSLKYEPKVWAEMNEHRLIVCKLEVNLEKSTAVFTATEMPEDGKTSTLEAAKAIYTQEIPYTDFPLEEVTMWLDMESRSHEGEQVLFLPSEY